MKKGVSAQASGKTPGSSSGFSREIKAPAISMDTAYSP